MAIRNRQDEYIFCFLRRNTDVSKTRKCIHPRQMALYFLFTILNPFSNFLPIYDIPKRLNKFGAFIFIVHIVRMLKHVENHDDL